MAHWCPLSFIVILAWIMGKPLSLLFDPYESIALFLAGKQNWTKVFCLLSSDFFKVITVNYVVQDGKSNWLEGFILMCLYVILAVTFWLITSIPLLPICLMIHRYYEPSSPADCDFLTKNSTLFT
jgi:Ca2+:H+ antiporter